MLLQIEFNNATRENDAQVSIFAIFANFWQFDDFGQLQNSLTVDD